MSFEIDSGWEHGFIHDEGYNHKFSDCWEPNTLTLMIYKDLMLGNIWSHGLCYFTTQRHSGKLQRSQFQLPWKFTNHWCSSELKYIYGLHTRHRLQRKPLVSDPSLHCGMCVTHVPWWMSGSLIRGGGENVPDFPGACANSNFTYLTRGPLPAHQGCHIHELNQWEMFLFGKIQSKIWTAAPRLFWS